MTGVMVLGVVVLAWIAASASGCAPHDHFEIPPILWSGDHLDYAPQEHAVPVCAGTMPYMDRYMHLLAAQMDVEIGRSVYVLGSHEDPSPCDEGALACFHDGAVVYSPMAPHEHELVHAARYDVGHPFTFFEEGAAEMLGGDDSLGDHVEPAGGSLREGLESSRPPGRLSLAWYTRAGTFSAYLHRYHGPEVTMALLRETSYSSTIDETIAILEETTKMPFDELVPDFERQESSCHMRRSYRYPVVPCDAPEALRPRCDGDRAVPIEVSLECDDPGTLGPREGQIFTYVAFDVPADGRYHFTALPREGGEKAWIEIKECELGCSSTFEALPYAYPLPLDPVVYKELDLTTFLRAGRYSLRFSRADEDGAARSLAVMIAGDDCG